ncbi:MAG: hypothetical protein IPK69_06215 [Phycisphaerales bacterium]|nr:MAG: hypothetical protein IPK69_06215 [Phycisphaerales bacterium]
MRGMKWRVFGAVLTASGMVALADDPPATPVTAPQPASQPAPASAPQPGGDGPVVDPMLVDHARVVVPVVVEDVRKITTADELLWALETADKSLNTLTAEVVWTKEFGLGGDAHVRKGRLFYRDTREHREPGVVVDQKGTRSFAATFDELTIGSRHEKELKHYVFDGTWLAEKEPGEQRMTRTKIAGEARRSDPMRLGEGPMPIPIGQRREDILARYEVSLLPAEEGVEDEASKAFVKGSYQMRLVSKDAQAEHSVIRLWYKPAADAKDAALIPRMARAVSRAENIDVMQLVGVELNPKIEEGVFSTSPVEGWKVIEQ